MSKRMWGAGCNADWHIHHNWYSKVMGRLVYVSWLWDFVHFLCCGILSCGILSCGILSVGILSCEILSCTGFCPVGFCPGFLRAATNLIRSIPALGDPRHERPHAVYGHVINVPTQLNVKLPVIGRHLPNAYVQSFIGWTLIMWPYTAGGRSWESIPYRREPYRRVPLGRVRLDERRLDEVQ